MNLFAAVMSLTLIVGCGVGPYQERLEQSVSDRRVKVAEERAAEAQRQKDAGQAQPGVPGQPPVAPPAGS